MKKLYPKDLQKIENSLYKTAETLQEYEKVEEKTDSILIQNLLYQLNEMIGEVFAYGLGYKQEGGAFSDEES